MAQKIIIRINKAKFPPTITTEVDGMQGQGCAAFSDELNQALRLETRAQRLKPEYQHVQQHIPQKR